MSCRSTLFLSAVAALWAPTASWASPSSAVSLTIAALWAPAAVAQVKMLNEGFEWPKVDYNDEDNEAPELMYRGHGLWHKTEDSNSVEYAIFRKSDTIMSPRKQVRWNKGGKEQQCLHIQWECEMMYGGLQTLTSCNKRETYVLSWMASGGSWTPDPDKMTVTVVDFLQDPFVKVKEQSYTTSGTIQDGVWDHFELEFVCPESETIAPQFRNFDSGHCIQIDDVKMRLASWNKVEM